jgi:hypothetical protein
MSEQKKPGLNALLQTGQYMGLKHAIRALEEQAAKLREELEQFDGFVFKEDGTVTLPTIDLTTT